MPPTAWRGSCSRQSSSGSRSSTSSAATSIRTGRFPNHEPNPLLPENREFIVAKVTEEKADLGVAYDGDADRCFFVDDTGGFVPGDFVTALLAEAVLSKSPGEKVIYDVRASWAVPETIERLGGTALVNRVGHAFIKQRMRAEDAVFAGEVSAHYYFRDFSQADTGVVPFLLMLELLSQSGGEALRAAPPVSRALLPHRRDQHAGHGCAPEAPGAQGALYAPKVAACRTSTESRSSSTTGTSTSVRRTRNRFSASISKRLSEQRMIEKRDEVLAVIRS